MILLFLSVRVSTRFLQLFPSMVQAFVTLHNMYMKLRKHYMMPLRPRNPPDFAEDAAAFLRSFSLTFLPMFWAPPNACAERLTEVVLG